LNTIPELWPDVALSPLVLRDQRGPSPDWFGRGHRSPRADSEPIHIVRPTGYRVLGCSSGLLPL